MKTGVKPKKYLYKDDIRTVHLMPFPQKAIID